MGMKVSGLASGMNTDDIVAKLMSANRIPLQKITQQKQTLEWRRDDYRNLNLKLMAFRDAAFNMKLQSNYMAKKLTSSNDNVLSVTGSASSNEGRYTVLVDRLAKSASMNSGKLGGPSGDDKKMSDLGLTEATVLTVGGERGTALIEIKEDDKLTDVVGMINAQSARTGVKVTYDSTMDKLFFVSSKTGTSANVTLNMQSTTLNPPPSGNADNVLAHVFKLDGAAMSTEDAQIVKSSATFTSIISLLDKDMTESRKLSVKVGSNDAIDVVVDNKTTVYELLNQLNTGLKDQEVSAYFGEDGKLAFFNTSGESITFSDDSPSGTALLDKLGLDAATREEQNNIKMSRIQTQGEDARVQFNGEWAEYATNTFTIGSMTFTAKQTSTTPVDVLVTHDVDAAFEKIKTFVDKYNELISDFNTKTSEKRYRDFLPLTEEQKKEMSEDDIKRWEEKAKSGLLFNDRMLQSGMGDLRQLLTGNLTGDQTGQLKRLSDIGISTTIVYGKSVSGSYLENGKLYIDETKLKEALAANAEDVMNLFIADDGDPSKMDGDGFANRLHAQATVLINNITTKAGAVGMVEDKYVMGKEMDRMDKRIASLTRRMEDLESRYYKQFTAMETYLNRMNAQSAWLTQQFSTGG